MKLFNYEITFKIKKREPIFPPDFAVVRYSKVSKKEGVFDEFNKVIIRYKDGMPLPPIPYSNAEVESLRKIAEIPVVEEPLSDEEFEFEEVGTFGEYD